MASALRGSLQDFGIAEVFQLIGQQRKTGVLEIERRGRRVVLEFDGGAVVRAWAGTPGPAAQDAALADMLLRCGLVTREQLQELQGQARRTMMRLSALAVEQGALGREQILEVEDLLTQEILFRILRWEEGSFVFTARRVEHDRPGRLLPAEQILMDGLRMADEWRTFADRVPSEDLVFQHVGRWEDYQAAHEGEDEARLEQAKRVFLLVDGRLPVRRVIDLARLGTFEVTRILAGLRREGLIEPLAPEQLARRRPGRRVELRAPPPRPWIAGALPMVLLVALALAAGRPQAPPQLGPEAFPLELRAVERAHWELRARRVRKALDDWYFEHGAWPTRPEQLVREGHLEAEALATAAGRPYYYARRGGEAYLLAPEYPAGPGRLPGPMGALGAQGGLEGVDVSDVPDVRDRAGSPG